MQQRIDHLESLVKRLIAQRQDTPSNNVRSGQDGPEPGNRSVMTAMVSDASDVAGSAGITVIDGVHSVYRGADDWHDVLQEVSKRKVFLLLFTFLLLFYLGLSSLSVSFRLLTHSLASYRDIGLIENQINKLQECWTQTQDTQNDSNVDSTLSNTVDGSSLLFGHVKQIEKLEILATLPPKPEVDKLIFHFFDRENFPITVARKLGQIVPCTTHTLTQPPAILHEPTFLREVLN